MRWSRLIKATLATNVLTVATGVAKTELTLWAALALDETWSRVVAYGAGLFVLAVMAPLSTALAHKLMRDGTGFRAWWTKRRLDVVTLLKVAAYLVISMAVLAVAAGIVLSWAEGEDQRRYDECPGGGDDEQP